MSLPYPRYTWYYTCDSSCITMLLLHQKVFVNRLVIVTNRLANGLFKKNLLCSKNSLTKIVGYQQPTLSLCQDSIRRWNHFAFMRIVFTFVQLFSFTWDRHQHKCVREMVFLFTCAKSECSAVEVACLAQNIRHSSASVRSSGA